MRRTTPPPATGFRNTSIVDTSNNNASDPNTSTYNPLSQTEPQQIDSRQRTINPRNRLSRHQSQARKGVENQQQQNVNRQLPMGMPPRISSNGISAMSNNAQPISQNLYPGAPMASTMAPSGIVHPMHSSQNMPSQAHLAQNQYMMNAGAMSNYAQPISQNLYTGAPMASTMAPSGIAHPMHSSQNMPSQTHLAQNQAMVNATLPLYRCQQLQASNAPHIHAAPILFSPTGWNPAMSQENVPMMSTNHQQSVQPQVNTLNQPQYKVRKISRLSDTAQSLINRSNSSEESQEGRKRSRLSDTARSLRNRSNSSEESQEFPNSYLRRIMLQLRGNRKGKKK